MFSYLLFKVLPIAQASYAEGLPPYYSSQQHAHKVCISTLCLQRVGTLFTTFILNHSLLMYILFHTSQSSVFLYLCSYMYRQTLAPKRLKNIYTNAIY